MKYTLILKVGRRQIVLPCKALVMTDQSDGGISGYLGPQE